MGIRTVCYALLFTSLTLSCEKGTVITYSPPSEISLARMPSALEARLIEANYVPWDPLKPALKPGDVIRNHNGIHLKWPKDDCFKAQSSPTLGQPLTIQSVTINNSEGSFALKFLEIAGADLSGSGVTSFTINLTDVHPLSLPTGWLSPSKAEEHCRADLSSDDHFAVSGILVGKINLTFFKSNDVGGSVNISDRVIEKLSLEAKGFTKSQGGDSVISKQSEVLGFMLPDISAEDFVTITLKEPGRKITESRLLNSFVMTENDREVEAQLYRLVKEQRDRTHSFMLNIVELWIGDVDFTLKQYTGRSLGKSQAPLTITYASAAQTKSQVIWDEESRKPINLVDSGKYPPVLVADIPVGRTFNVNLASKDKNSFCNDNREYDFFTFIGAGKYEWLEGLTFLFLVHKNIAENFNHIPMDVIELQESLEKGRRMFLPAYLTDFLVDDLRHDYGNQAMDKFYSDSIARFKKAFPQEPLLNNIKSQDFEAYRITFVPLKRQYAVSFKCR